FDYNTPDDADPIIAVPVSAARFHQNTRQHLHIVHKNGTSCDGREFVNERFTQTFILMSKDGDSLSAILGDAKPTGLTPDGYIVVKMACTHESVSSPGGCFPDSDNDVITTVDD